MIRLDKFLCDAGAGTRSQVKAIIKSGRVTAGGAVLRDPNQKIDPEALEIALDGDVLGKKKGRTLVMLHKPAGYVTATEDACQKTVMEHHQGSPLLFSQNLPVKGNFHSFRINFLVGISQYGLSCRNPAGFNNGFHLASGTGTGIAQEFIQSYHNSSVLSTLVPS